MAKNIYKRIFLYLCLCLITGATAFAQQVEVKGVVTERVDNRRERGFGFTNLNNHAVIVQAELRTPASAESRLPYIVRDTKSFALGARETFFWQMPTGGWAAGINTFQNTYVVFRAFKFEEIKSEN